MSVCVYGEGHVTMHTLLLASVYVWGGTSYDAHVQAREQLCGSAFSFHHYTGLENRTQMTGLCFHPQEAFDILKEQDRVP